MATGLIRTAVLSDMEVLRDVFRRSSLSNAGDRGNLLANPDALVLGDDAVREGRTRVAVRNGAVVGFATTLVEGGTAELVDLFVDPASMGRGVGRELVLDAAAALAQRGVRRLGVTANPHALAFYERVGFVADGAAATRFGPAPRMRLDLGS